MGEDRWVPTVCYACFGYCGIQVHVVDGVAREVAGNPRAPNNAGKVCPKGIANLMALYNPQRVSRPLRRTNPQKGMGVDPRWEEMDWDEALDLVSQKLRQVREEDPRKVVVSTFDNAAMGMAEAWATAYGTPNTHWTGYFCGNALHPVTFLTNGTFHSEIDLDYCQYLILFGSQQGFLAGVNPNIMAQKTAEARRRGMHVVVVDPVGSNAASKADEWVPIRPGTDAALALAIVNVLVNDLGIYDREFLARQTNGAYLVWQDGRYVREAGSGKPMVWDQIRGEAVAYDGLEGDPSLEGGPFVADGQECRPAFQVLKEHVAAYTCERAAEITSIPAATIRRLAEEYGRAAQVGSTISVEGEQLPYRPAAVLFYRGAEAHKHGMLANLSIQYLNLLIGGMYAVGSYRGNNPLGPGWEVGVGPDGMIVGPVGLSHGSRPYPPRKAYPPDNLGLEGLFPLGHNLSPAVQLSILESDLFHLPYKPEVLIFCRTNLMMTRSNPLQMEETLKKFSFILCFANEMNETAEMADVVLPEAHNYERLDPLPQGARITVSPSTGQWYWSITQPVVEPPPGVKNWLAVLLDIADRVGFREELYEVINATRHLKAPHRLDPKSRYTWEQITDRELKSRLGDDYGLEWFRENGVLAKDRTLQEKYPRPWIRARFPVYHEYLLAVGADVGGVAASLGLGDWDVSDYQPIPDWKPCPAFQAQDREARVYVANSKVPFHALSATTGNPWLHDLTDRHPYAHKIMMHPQVAARHGIRDGDRVRLESEAGMTRGVARVTECVHPEVVATSGALGHWSAGKPVGQGTGPHYNSLLPINLDRMDMLCSALDACILARVSREDAEQHQVR